MSLAEIPYGVEEEYSDSAEGINVIKGILNLLGIEYDCKECITQSICTVIDHIEECDGAGEVFDNWFNFHIIKDILDFMDKERAIIFD